MTAVRTAVFIFLMLTGALLCLALGVYGYLLVTQAAGADSTVVKVLAERMLFLGLLAAIAVVGFSAAVFIRSVRIHAALDRLVALSRLSGGFSGEPLSRLGELGTRISELYKHVTEVSEKKSQKISAISSLNQFLLNRIELKIVITDVAGRITQLSKPFVDEQESGRQDFLGLHVNQLLPDLNFHEVFTTLERTHGAVEVTVKAGAFRMFPILDRNNHVAYCVGLLGSGMKLELPSPRPRGRTEEKKGERQSLWSRFRNLGGRGQQGNGTRE